MNAFKTVMLWILIGVVVGAAAASWIAPGVLAWNNTPGQGQALCDCVKVTRSTTADLLRAQLIGAGIGATVLLFIGLLIARAGRHHKTAPPAAPPAAPTTGAR